MTDDAVRGLLRELAEADASAKAPPELELRLRKEFRAHHRRKSWRSLGFWVLPVPVAAVIFLAILTLVHRRPPTESANGVSINTPVTISSEQALRPETSRPAATTPAPRASVLSAPETEEVVTEFFPLMDPAPPFQRGQLLRVELPASVMQIVGLPVREEHLADPVQADVLIGEEGLPRAIRFVTFEVR